LIKKPINQKNKTVMKKTALTFIAIELLFILLFAFFLSSCKTTGYGCKGKASWNDVVRKANRMY